MKQLLQNLIKSNRTAISYPRMSYLQIALTR